VTNVGTPENLAIVQRIWDKLPEGSSYDIESGVTSFHETLGSGPLEWCLNVLRTIDQHHGEFSHDPPYSVLEVYGLFFSEPLRTSFCEHGFTSFEATPEGFIARKETSNFSSSGRESAWVVCL
jgi:hypothetical protein